MAKDIKIIYSDIVDRGIEDKKILWETNWSPTDKLSYTSADITTTVEITRHNIEFFVGDDDGE